MGVVVPIFKKLDHGVSSGGISQLNLPWKAYGALPKGKSPFVCEELSLSALFLNFISSPQVLCGAVWCYGRKEVKSHHVQQFVVILGSTYGDVMGGQGGT